VNIVPHVDQPHESNFMNSLLVSLEIGVQMEGSVTERTLESPNMLSIDMFDSLAECAVPVIALRTGEW
jgi:hypothetical protein